MTVRATWKGAIKLSLIAIPIRVFPATTSGSDVSFRQLHRKCRTPIQLKKWCPHCDQEVTHDDIVKGYEGAKGRFVVVEEEEVDQLRPESTHTVDLSHILPEPTIDPAYIERVYYLAPDGKAAGSAFAVLRDALQDRTAVGRLALHGREYLVAVRPHEQAMVLYTLRTAGEVRALDEADGLEFIASRVKTDEVKLARQVLDHLETRDDLSDFTDHYQESLRKMLAAKTDDAVVVTEKSAKPARVVDLMDALRQSLARVQERPTGKRTARRAKAKVITHPGVKARGKRRKAS